MGFLHPSINEIEFSVNQSPFVLLYFNLILLFFIFSHNSADTFSYYCSTLSPLVVFLDGEILRVKCSALQR